MALPSTPTGLPCTVCRKAPRMISSSGKELTRCEEHQREYWRAAQKRKTPKQGEQRTCPQCGQTLPLDQFPKNGNYRKKLCKTCYSQQVSAAKHSDKPRITLPPITPFTRVYPSPAPAAVPSQGSLVFIDPATNRVIFCDVISEKVTSDRNLPHLIQTYLAGGYRVVIASEQKETDDVPTVL